MSEPSDRRAAERFPVNQDTACSFVSPVDENFGPARIKNVSTSGVGLVLSKKVDVGALLAVGVNNKAKNFARNLLVRVVHVTEQSKGSYLVGGTFQTPLTYEELVALVM
jgi:hypothetical protein